MSRRAKLQRGESTSTTITTALPIAAKEGDTVRIVGLRGMDINGDWIVSKIAEDGAIVLGRVKSKRRRQKE